MRDRAKRTAQRGPVWTDDRLAHRAHRTTGDDPGSRRSRLQQNAAGTFFTHHFVRDGRADSGHHEHRTLRDLDTLLDRCRNLFRLAVADADPAVAVADDDERREREAPAALDHLRNAVDGDDCLLELWGSTIVGATGPATLDHI